MKISEALPPKPTDQILHLRKKNEELERRVESLRESIGAQKEIAQAIRDSVVAADPYPSSFEIRSPKKKLPRVAGVLLLGDLHIGERVEAKETEGFGRYSLSIARRRINCIISSFLRYIQVQRYVYDIRTCQVFGLADYVSGSIHHELEVTNEFPVPVAAVHAGYLIGEAVREVASAFETVHFGQIGADNHGRLTTKNQFKQGAFNNWSYVVNEISSAYLRQCSNLTVEMAPGVKHLWPVAGKWFLVEHGHTLRGWMGIPFYGMERAAGREAIKRMKTGKEFDYQCYGHFHVANFLFRRIIMNGSLSGTNEFDHAQGRFSGPAQVGFMVSPKHGVFNFTAWSGD